MRGEYSTKQRAMILDFVKESGSHLTVSDIMRGLELRGHTVSRATVYRSLERLCRTGEIKKFTVDENGAACYQRSLAECNSHFHLKCLKCGRLIHLDCHFLSELEGHILKDHGFTVSSGKTVIYGVCSECSEK